MTYKIEKNITPPVRHTWPFSQMEVGDSVLIPADLRRRAQIYAHSYFSEHGKTGTTEMQKDGSLRVWRLT